MRDPPPFPPPPLPYLLSFFPSSLLNIESTLMSMNCWCRWIDGRSIFILFWNEIRPSNTNFGFWPVTYTGGLRGTESPMIGGFWSRRISNRHCYEQAKRSEGQGALWATPSFIHYPFSILSSPSESPHPLPFSKSSFGYRNAEPALSKILRTLLTLIIYKIGKVRHG